MMKNNITNCITMKDDVCDMNSAEAAPPAVTSLQSVVTGTPTAPNATATVLAMSATRAENIGLKPSPMSIAAGIATAVPKPAIPSSRPPKPHTMSNTTMPLSSEMLVNCALITSISFVSRRML